MIVPTATHLFPSIPGTIYCSHACLLYVSEAMSDDPFPEDQSYCDEGADLLFRKGQDDLAPHPGVHTASVGGRRRHVPPVGGESAGAPAVQGEAS